MATRRTPSPATCTPDTAALARAAILPDDESADAELARFAKALGHPVRVRIVRLLARKEARMCSHIVDELPLAQSTVSEHLRILKGAGLIVANERGPRVGYCIAPVALARVKALLEAL
jgi:ArsR family transcriptional regulator, arsenate/arsenite/antimonite-responsive transcriptional repressor